MSSTSEIERWRDNPNLDSEGRLKLRIQIRRELGSPYLAFGKIDRAAPLLEDPGAVLVRLRDLVDLRRGSHGETIGYLAYDRESARLAAIALRDGYGLDVDEDAVDAVVDAAGGPQ